MFGLSRLVVLYTGALLKPPHRLAALVVLSLTAVWTIQVLAGYSEYFGDESPWITSGEVTLRLVEHLAPPSEWQHAYVDAKLGDWGLMNPPIGKLYFGLILRLTGIHDTKRYRWEYGHGEAENQALGNMPPMEWVTPVRLGVVVMGGLSLWLVYLGAWQLLRHWTALLAPLVVFSAMSFFATHVLTEVPELVLILASGYLLLRYVERPSLGLLTASAVVAGLACAVKYSAAQSVIALVLVTIWAPDSWWKRFRHTVIALTLPFLVFVAVNPFLYPAPVLRTISLIGAWYWNKGFQQHLALFAPVAVWTRSDALYLVTMRAILPDVSILPWVFARWAALTIIVGLGLAGLWPIARTRPRIVAAWTILSGSSFVMTVLWLPLNWSQYYLPVIIWTPPLLVLGLASCGSLVMTQWSSSSKVSSFSARSSRSTSSG